MIIKNIAEAKKFLAIIRANVKHVSGEHQAVITYIS